MTPVALLYNLTDPAKLQVLRLALLRSGVRGRAVAPEEYGHPVGWLCGLEGFSPAGAADGSGFSDEMLVLYGLSGAQLDAFLNTLRLGHAGIALKAVVTEHNAAWSSLRLHDELRQEHEAMGAQRMGGGRKQTRRRK